MECSCTLAALRGHRTWKVYDWGGVGWGGMITSMHACGTMWCYVDGMFLHVGSSTWSPHMESIWLGWGGVGWGGMITSMHACGTMWCYVDGMFLHVGSSTWSPHMESIWLGWGGVGWDDNVHARLRNYVMLRWWNVLARWQLYVVTAHGKYMIGVGWGGVYILDTHTHTYIYILTCCFGFSRSFFRFEWTRKVRVRGREKVAGTQQIDRCWNHLKKKLPQSNEEPHWPNNQC